VADVLAINPTAQAEAERITVASAARAEMPVRANGFNHAAPPQIVAPAAIDAEPSDGAMSVVRSAPPLPASLFAVAPSASAPEDVMPTSRDADGVAQEARRQEAARQEAARLELARLEAERQEAARQAAAQLDGQRQEAARQEAVRVEAARPDAERQEAARQATAPREAPRVEADREPTARREAALRAIGRQLDEEADRAEAASRAARRPSTLPLSLSTARRARVWGRTDPNVELIQYVEEWARRIQFNTSVETVRDVAKRSHTRPMVTVAIRSGGSVESVTFVVSSGVAEVDEAIRRIVESQRPYQAFPPALAREFDVIEIRRIWHFDSAVRLY
jgi:outer membrane biosynthesis protein TonB